jgi:hypothetical protein
MDMLNNMTQVFCIVLINHDAIFVPHKYIQIYLSTYN